MFKTIRSGLLAMMLAAAACSMDSVEDRGSTIECYETDDGLVCHDGEGDGTDGAEGEDTDGDGEKDVPVCTAEVTCEKVCEEGEGGFACVKECTDGVRCEWGCEGDACYEECTAPEECREEEPAPCEPGDGTPDDGGEPGLLPDECGGDDGGEEPPPDDGGGDEPPTDEPPTDEPPTDEPPAEG